VQPTFRGGMNYGFSSTLGFCVKNDAVHGFGFLDSYDSVCMGPLLNLGKEWSRLLVFIREGLGELDNKKKSFVCSLIRKVSMAVRWWDVVTTLMWNWRGWFQGGLVWLEAYFFIGDVEPYLADSWNEWGHRSRAHLERGGYKLWLFEHLRFLREERCCVCTILIFGVHISQNAGSVTQVGQRVEPSVDLERRISKKKEKKFVCSRCRPVDGMWWKP
jgi:hypothetical protein